MSHIDPDTLKSNVRGIILGEGNASEEGILPRLTGLRKDYRDAYTDIGSGDDGWISGKVTMGPHTSPVTGAVANACTSFLNVAADELKQVLSEHKDGTDALEKYATKVIDIADDAHETDNLVGEGFSSFLRELDGIGG